MKNKYHSFNIDIAKKYGVEAAIIVHNMQYWIEKNAHNEKHLIDGRYWTYNSRSAFAELFPYINEQKIKRVLQLLCDAGILLKGNFNKNNFDRTNWYAFVNQDEWITLPSSINQNDPHDRVKMTNGEDQNDPVRLGQNDQSITNSKPSSKPSNSNHIQHAHGQASMFDVDPKPKKKKFIPPTLEEVKEFFRQKNFTESAAIKAFEYYEAGEWKDRTGTPVINWKQKMIAVWFKHENSIFNEQANRNPKAINGNKWNITAEGINNIVNSG